MKKQLPILLISFLWTGLFSACTLYRGIVHGGPGIEDHRIFAQDLIQTGDSVFRFTAGKSKKLEFQKMKFLKSGKVVANVPLDTLLTYSKTTAFLIIRNDSILFEHYYLGYEQKKRSTVFSVSKSLTCLLAKIAIDEGAIGSVNDPVWKYFPEILTKDTNFRKLTVRHLMDMRASIRYEENYGWNPFSKIGRTYYGRNSLGEMKKLRAEREPGEQHHYQSISTNILGVVIERATGIPLAKYMEQKIWQPLGMEYPASLSLDNKKQRIPKAFGGFAATAVDLAKIGRLYLNNGNWNGVQLIDSSWVQIVSTPFIENYGYQLSWRSLRVMLPDSAGRISFPDSLSVATRIRESGADPAQYIIDSNVSKKQGRLWYGHGFTSPVYYAEGILGQYIYIHPQKKVIIVRLGKRDDFMDYLPFMDMIANWL